MKANSQRIEQLNNIEGPRAYKGNVQRKRS